ncbi:MAG: hypothetical protein ACK4S4_01040 [Pyrinomonadaceae bacterium]
MPATPGTNPQPSGDPRGRWNGEWSTVSGAYHALQVTLDSDKNDGLTGQIAWTLKRTPRPDKQSKVGLSATEHVTGRYDPASRVVRLKGHSKTDPGGLLVMLDEYRLDLSADSQRPAGQARNAGKWNGIVNLTR